VNFAELAPRPASWARSRARRSAHLALSIVAGLVKSIMVMTGKPFVAKAIGLNNAKSAMICGA
jgi:Malonate/sodium symporter MadM subunit